jgi:AcrR family transcriptional regulator
MSTRKEEIVQIAGDLFARRGFAATTVREIADEAGILSGSLYHHFDSKEAIAEDILSRYYDGMAERYSAIAKEHGDESCSLAELIRVAFSGIRDDPQAVGLIQNSGDLLLENERFAHIREVNAELKRIWLNVINSGIRSGVFKPDTDAKLLRRFVRDSLSAAVRWWRPDGRYTIEEVADRYIDMIYGGILTKPRAAPKRGSKGS